jgi:hypothetical protein
MPWIIRHQSGFTGVVAEHRASGVRLTLGHKTECLCEDCLEVPAADRRAVERWLRALPDPPAGLVDHLAERRETYS